MGAEGLLAVKETISQLNGRNSVQEGNVPLLSVGPSGIGGSIRGNLRKLR